MLLSGEWKSNLANDKIKRMILMLITYHIGCHMTFIKINIK